MVGRNQTALHQDMKARPSIVLDTVGNRVPVRSILEAKWAHFFTLIHLPWEYEPEVKTRFYRPDFLTSEAFIEIKPWHQAAKDRANTNASLAYPHQRFLLLCSSPRSSSPKPPEPRTASTSSLPTPNRRSSPHSGHNLTPRYKPPTIAVRILSPFRTSRRLQIS